ncbi:MAG: hypothetical protein ACRYG2_36715 [Janthinobacterium lividum]
MDVFRALLHDSAGPGQVRDVPAHRALLDSAHGWVVGPLVVDDERLAGFDAAADVPLDVRVGGGAGGIAALARRAGGLRLVAAETLLRDLDDLAGNATRVVAAAAELPEGVDVFVGLPGTPGTVGAVEVVEAAGLLARIDLSGAGAVPRPAELLSVLVEADLEFKATGLGTEPFGPYGVVAVLMAVEALVDGAEPKDAEALLAEVDEHRAGIALSAWDTSTADRVRRRLRGVDCVDVVATLERLAGAGLLSLPDGA